MASSNIILISAVLLAVYLVSLYLSRQGKYLNVLLHRKIWNALLIASFILTALTAIFYLLSLEYNLNIIPQQIDLYFWHMEFGLAFVMIGAFHALWHIPYFKQYLPKDVPKPAAPAQPAAPQTKQPDAPA